jgi:competence protein ComEC
VAWAKVQDQLVRRPLLTATVFLILGIAGHRVVEVGPRILIALVAACVALAVVSRQRAVADVIIGIALVLVGVAVARLDGFYFSNDHIGRFTREHPRLARLEVEVVTAPRVISSGGDARPLPARQIMQGEVRKILTSEGWQSGSGRVLIQLQEPRGDLEIRQTLLVLGMLERPAPAMNPGQVDWASHYREQRVLASIEVPHGGNVSIIAAPGPNVLDRVRAKVRSALAEGFSRERSLDHALLRALVLGDSDPQLRDVQEEFQRTGTSHHLAISGMHVAVIGWLVYAVCRWFLVSPRKAAWAGMIVVVMYGAVALPSAPVIRSVLFCLLFGLGLVSIRSLDGVHLVALSALLMLVYHPLDLFNAGFQLSFGTTLGLLLFTPKMVAWLHTKMLDPDVEIARRAQMPTRWSERKRWLKLKTADVLGATLIASVVAAPLTAFHFNQFSIWSIAATIVLIPPVFLSLVIGVLKILVSLVCPPLSPVMAELAAWPVMAMRWCVEFFAKLPGNDVALPLQSVWVVLAFYLLLAAFLIPVQKVGVRRTMKGLVAAGMAMLLFLPLLIGPTVAKSGELRLTMLAVGAGQCAVMELPGGKVMLVDAGSQGTDLWRKCVGPYLKTRGISQVDSIYLSHANYDHYSGVADGVRVGRPKYVFVGPMFEVQAREHLAGKVLLSELGDLQQVISAGRRIELDRETMLEVIWPSVGNRNLLANDTSLVMKVTLRGGGTILFTGDIQEAAMRALLRTPELLKCDVLVAPHHGSSELATAEFVKAADPKVIISSNDSTLTQKQRAFDRVVADRTLYRTHECGAVTVTIDAGGNVGVETFRQGARNFLSTKSTKGH